MSNFMGSTEEVKEKQIKRLLKHGKRGYSVEDRAEEMVEYAEFKGVTLKKITQAFGTERKLYKSFIWA